MRLEDCCKSCPNCASWPAVFCFDLDEFCGHADPVCHDCCNRDHLEETPC
jgi:hypothetical protein